MADGIIDLMSLSLRSLKVVASRSQAALLAYLNSILLRSLGLGETTKSGVSLAWLLLLAVWEMVIITEDLSLLPLAKYRLSLFCMIPDVTGSFSRI